MLKATNMAQDRAASGVLGKNDINIGDEKSGRLCIEKIWHKTKYR